MKKQVHKIKFLIGALALLFVAGACSEDVLDQAPFSELSQSKFWKNNQQAELGIGAIYSSMQDEYKKRYYYYGEMRSGNYTVQTSGGENGIELTSDAIIPSNGGVLSWDALYQMIGRANTAIKNIPDIPQYNKSLLGEAYVLRAFAYFTAARVWGKAPVFLSPIQSLNDTLRRPATDGDKIIQDIVIPDMLKAEQLIVPPSAKYRFSKTSVWAFEASVYMWEHDYENAKAKLDNIVNSGEFELTTTRKDWENLFINDLNSGRRVQEGPELILSLNFDADTGDEGGIYSLFFAGVPSFFISPYAENKWTEKFPTDSLSWVAKYPDPANLPKTYQTDADGNKTDKLLFGDWRYYETREEGSIIGEARVAKWNKSNYSQNDDSTDEVLYRYAGVLLMLAEAENQLDNPNRALELLNQIRTARQLPLVKDATWTSSSTEERESIILDERQFELFGEAKRWWDLQRTDRAVKLLDTINGQTKATLKFPIFIDHLLENPELEQVEAYN